MPPGNYRSHGVIIAIVIRGGRGRRGQWGQFRRMQDIVCAGFDVAVSFFFFGFCTKILSVEFRPENSFPLFPLIIHIGKLIKTIRSWTLSIVL